MEKRVSALILIVLLSSTLANPDNRTQSVEGTSGDLYPEVTRIEISPDPNSVRDLGSPVISEGTEGRRGLWADSSVGIYTTSGLLPHADVPSSLMEARPDLMVVLVSPDTGLWEARISILESAHVAVRTTIPPSGFLIQGGKEALQSVSRLPFVEASHTVPLALLIEDRLWDSESTTEVEMTGWKDADLNRLDSPGVGLTGSVSSLAQLNLLGAWSPTTGIHFGEVEPSVIPELAMNPEVAYISTKPHLTTWNNLARTHMEANSVESYFFTGLNGSGQRVAVADTGIDHDHGDFGSRIVQRIDVANDGSTADTNDGHGTHVACTVLGSGSRTSAYEGIAPQAELYMQAMEDDDSGALSGPGVYSLLNSAYSSGGARIHTNSWGSLSSGGYYSTQSEDADDRTSTWDQYWTYDGMTVLFAAGNERDDGVSPPGTAKNVITVGAHVNRYSSNAEDEMYYWSSRGPTDDGRIKPDVVAAGDYVRSCRAQEASEAPDNINDDWYVEYSGTSMATPAAAGASALVREYLMEVAERPEPQGALVKAMLILGAEDMGTRDIPNNDEGWGRVNLVNTLLPDSDVGIFVDDRSRLSSGQEASYNFDVTRSGEPLKVVLAWSDYPGSTFSSTQLRNNLNLEVTSPDGSVTYVGNDFANGRSTTGGAKDAKNNVEVVLIDSAVTGIWNVKVKDFSHGGSRTYQPFAIAVRGVNVNDLTPDPSIAPGSFEISTPIPQVGEATSFSVSVVNQGSGSFAQAFVSAHVNGDPLETKSLGMSPGEEVRLEWDWTPEPSDKGETQIRIEIDPSDQIEELYEDNNVLEVTVGVSAPGIQASTDSAWKTLQDPSDTTTRWEVEMTNLAMFDTNASIEVTKPVRMIDGVEFDWFKSFDQIYVELGPSESTTVNLTLVHPAPPDPGTYSMTITATDEDYDVESQLEIYFDVPVLAQPEVTLPSAQIQVDSREITNTSVQIHNLGNGAQTYDIELYSPAGWEVGLLELGPFQGSKQGSTGTLSKGGSISAGIMITPPGVLLTAGSTFFAEIKVKSRVSSEVWTFQMPMVIQPSDSLGLAPESGGTQGGVPADSLHEISVQISNQGNREVTLTPIERSLPGGWTIQGGLSQITIPMGSNAQWSFSIQGNGLAASGLVEVRFLVEDGDFFDWNTTVDSVSGAIPVLSFQEVVFVEGTTIESSTTPLGLGAHPVGSPFDMGWKLENAGTSIWEPEVSMELPSDDWQSSCAANPARVGPGESSMVWCSITIPLSHEAGSEPGIALVLSGDGIESRGEVTLLVDTVKEVEWTLVNYNEAREDSLTTIQLDALNTGNVALSERIVTDAPDGWDLWLDGQLLILQPGEAKSVVIQFTPDSGSDGTITLRLGTEEEPISQKTLEVPVTATSSGGPSTLLLVGGAALLVAVAAVVGAIAFTRGGRGPSSTIPARSGSQRPHREEATGHQEPSTPQADEEEATAPEGPELQRYPDYPGWLWNPSTEEWVEDPEYEHEGQ